MRDRRDHETGQLLSQIERITTVDGLEDQCDQILELPNGRKHFCIRPRNHTGQHYSFSGDPRYEIVWPLEDARGQIPAATKGP